ncbi:MAG: M28 family metallopeptidase [Promethearchaeota archaeon]
MNFAHLNEYMYNFIEEVCNEIGPRESGSESEKLTGDKIESELKNYCDETWQEKYIAHPTAFLGGVRYGTVLVFVSIIMYWVSLLTDLNIIQLEISWSYIFMIIGIIILFLADSYFILEVMRYHEVFDFLFPKKDSNNIVGVIYPTKEVKQSVIFSAHHDSAYEFNLFYYFKRFGQKTINFAYIGIVFILIVLIAKFILNIFNVRANMIFLTLGIAFLFFLPIFIPYLFFHSYKSVLGACDNLSGVAIILGIARYLSENKKDFVPQNTKVYFVSFAGEEAGIRGAKRYVDMHYQQLKNENTKVVNIDSIATPETILIATKEIIIGVKHEKEIYEKLYEIAKENGINGKMVPITFGATDGAAFSKKKIAATSISGLDLENELVPFYHTRLDTPEVVDPKALGLIVKMCVNYLKRIDMES